MPKDTMTNRILAAILGWDPLVEGTAKKYQYQVKTDPDRYGYQSAPTAIKFGTGRKAVSVGKELAEQLTNPKSYNDKQLNKTIKKYIKKT